ncbi:hypothetical protein D3C74_287850 [compost metagenome]
MKDFLSTLLDDLEQKAAGLPPGDWTTACRPIFPEGREVWVPNVIRTPSTSSGQDLDCGLDVALAEGLVAARNHFPPMVAALKAVRALHRPIDVFELASSCGHPPEKHTIFEASDGEWCCADSLTGRACEECSPDEGGEHHDWPCRTVLAVENAWTGDPS